MTPRAERFGALAVATTFALIPLYAGVSLLDPSRPNLALGIAPRVALASAIVAALAVAGCVVVFLRSPRPLPGLFLVLCLNAAETCIAGLAGFDPLPGVLGGGILLVAMVFIHAATTIVYPRPGAAKLILTTLLCSGILASAVAVGMTLSRHPAALYAENHGRAVGTFLNSNELAFYGLILVATAFGVAISAPRGRFRMLAWITVLCAMGAVFMTFSRSGYIALAAEMAFFVVVARPRVWISMVMVAAVALIVAGGFTVDTHHNPSENFSRVAAWQAGVRTIERFPLLGVGPLAYYRTYPLTRSPDGPQSGEPISFDPHNMVLSIAAEEGLAGVAVVGLFFWTFFVLFRRGLARATPQGRLFGLAICAGIVGSSIHLMLNSISLAFLIWPQFCSLALVGLEYGPGGDASE